jgi:hypothetical protein|tara:strand:+ start:3874 stop:4587 length:714 start_codon:yes stop_codon:yes gene_type:complete
VHIDGLKGFKGNEYTAFGTAMHEVCEKTALKELKEEDKEEFFMKKFLKELISLPDDLKLNENLVNSMREQGKALIPEVFPALEDYFNDYEVVSTEEKLYEMMGDIAPEEYSFKGYIDLVVRTNDGKYHIIDWKTCSWGWDARKKSEKMITYQLTLYKHYFAKKHGIDPSMIETHFALLKRTAKKDRVEIFRVTSGPRKTENALNLLKKALYNIAASRHIKNRLSCSKCEFCKTKHCP